MQNNQCDTTIVGNGDDMRRTKHHSSHVYGELIKPGLLLPSIKIQTNTCRTKSKIVVVST